VDNRKESNNKMIIDKKELSLLQRPTIVNSILLVVSLTLLITKVIFALISNSLALMADAFDSLTDIVMALVALIGLIYSNKKPNEKFPYGYYKIENIISLIIAFFIFITAYNVISQAINDLFSFFIGTKKAIVLTPEIIIFLISSLLTSIILTVYLKIVGKRIGSPIILSQASEKFYDNFISVSVIIGFIAVFFNISLLDSIIGLLIAVFILKGGYDIFLLSTKTLLDAVIDFENRTELCNIFNQHPKIKKVEKLEIRSYGKYIMIEVTISLNKDLHLNQIESLKRILSKEITTKFPQIFKIIIFSQTPQIKITKLAIPLENNDDLESKVSDHFGDSPFFAIVEIKGDKDDKKLEGYIIITNKFKNVEKRKGILISDWLASEKVDKVYLKKELKTGPKLIFENSLIQTEVTVSDTLIQIINIELQIKPAI